MLRKLLKYRRTFFAFCIIMIAVISSAMHFISLKSTATQYKRISTLEHARNSSAQPSSPKQKAPDFAVALGDIYKRRSSFNPQTSMLHNSSKNRNALKFTGHDNFQTKTSKVKPILRTSEALSTTAVKINFNNDTKFIFSNKETKPNWEMTTKIVTSESGFKTIDTISSPSLKTTPDSTTRVWDSVLQSDSKSTNTSYSKLESNNGIAVSNISNTTIKLTMKNGISQSNTSKNNTSLLKSMSDVKNITPYLSFNKEGTVKNIIHFTSKNGSNVSESVFQKKNITGNSTKKSISTFFTSLAENKNITTNSKKIKEIPSLKLSVANNNITLNSTIIKEIPSHKLAVELNNITLNLTLQNNEILFSKLVSEIKYHPSNSTILLNSSTSTTSVIENNNSTSKLHLINESTSQKSVLDSNSKTPILEMTNESNSLKPETKSLKSASNSEINIESIVNMSMSKNKFSTLNATIINDKSYVTSNSTLKNESVFLKTKLDNVNNPSYSMFEKDSSSKIATVNKDGSPFNVTLINGNKSSKQTSQNKSNTVTQTGKNEKFQRDSLLANLGKNQNSSENVKHNDLLPSSKKESKNQNDHLKNDSVGATEANVTTQHLSEKQRKHISNILTKNNSISGTNSTNITSYDTVKSYLMNQSYSVAVPTAKQNSPASEMVDLPYRQFMVNLNDSSYYDPYIQVILDSKTGCQNISSYDAVMAVHSAPWNTANRKAFRWLYSNYDKSKPYRIKVLFFVGIANTTSMQSKLASESQTYGDIVQGSFLDSYRNLTYKAVFVFKWLTDRCPGLKLLLRLDDDVFMSFPYFAHTWNNLPKPVNNSILCDAAVHDRVLRNGKWPVSKSEISESRYHFYHCYGYFAALTPDLVPRMDAMARRTPFFWIDDIFMYGFVAKKVGAKFVNVYRHMSRWDEKKFTGCLREQGKKCPLLTFITKPNKFRFLYHLATSPSEKSRNSPLTGKQIRT